LSEIPANAEPSFKAKGETDTQSKITDPQKKKKILSPLQMEKKIQRDNLRRTMFIKMKEEESLRIGMCIRDIVLKEQGFDVKPEEDKSEKYEFDAYKQAKKIQNGEPTYPRWPASVGCGSVSSYQPWLDALQDRCAKTTS
jgi:uncharacterized lipoprotein